MRSAVDVIGRCKRAMSVSVPAKLDRGERESVPFPCPSRLRPGYCFISLFSLQVQGGVVWYAPFPLSSLGLSVLPLAHSDWLMFVELNFLLRNYTFRRSPTPS